MVSGTATTTRSSRRCARSPTRASWGSAQSSPRATGSRRRRTLQLYVVSDTNDVAGAEELFASGRATLVVPESVGPVPDGVPELRAGAGPFVDLGVVSRVLAGQVVIAEGGPTLAGLLAADDLLDEFFVTIAPRVIAGSSQRVAHGPDADASLWELAHGFLDDDGFLFLRYCRCV